MIKKYLQYLRHNPKDYWFKRKLFGWGWTPVTWQGWLVTMAFIILVTWQAICLEIQHGPEVTGKPLILFFARLFIAIIIFCAIAYWKGEKPKWQWGFPRDEKE